MRNEALRKFLDSAKGLGPPSKPGDPIANLHHLLVTRDCRTSELVCSCEGRSWLKLGDRFVCWACKEVEAVSDGRGGWKIIDPNLYFACLRCCHMLTQLEQDSLSAAIACPSCGMPNAFGPGVFIDEHRGYPLQKVLQMRHRKFPLGPRHGP